MHLQRELLSLTIVAFAASSNVVTATSTSDRHLRGSSGEGEANTVEELPSDLAADYALVDTEERELARFGNGLGRGQGLGKGKTTATTTTVPTTTLLPDGGAVSTPSPDVGDPVSIITIACEPACGSDQVCAREAPGADAQCYDKCSAYPLGSRDTCSGVCVSTTFTCGGYESVFNEFCECGNSSEFPDTYADGCRPSECGLFV